VNPNAPAFPQPIAFTPNGEAVTSGFYFADVNGIPIRLWLAGQALAGMKYDRSSSPSRIREMSDEAIEIADAVITAHVRKGGEA
jgi:hypothetical protein